MARSLRRHATSVGTRVRAAEGHLLRLPYITIVALLLVPSAVGAQPDDANAVPRTPWGHPDFQGIWLYQTLTPLQRPEDLGNKTVLSLEEAASFVADQNAFLDRILRTSGDWGPRTGLTNSRTSQITDPPTGRLPTRTPAAERRVQTMVVYLPGDGKADGPEDRGPYERCILGRSVPFRAHEFEQRVHIVQTPELVVLMDEFGELRLIPVTEWPRLPLLIRQWRGQSRGRWDGDTLVVETTSFNGKWSFLGSGRNMRLVERFSRNTSGTLEYEFTVDDPESFSRPWTVSFPFTEDPGPIYDNACHEGNRSMPLILRGARAEERAVDGPQ